MRQPNTSLAVCWAIEKSDGTFIRGTAHDCNIKIEPTESPPEFAAGTYLAAAGISGSDVRTSADMSVDNLDVQGALQTSPDVIDVAVSDIEAGLLDNAPVQVIVTNWAKPSDGYYIVRRGYLGEISRNSDGAYTTEIRGLTQVLQQTIGRTAGDRCDVAEFGDSRCKFNVAAATVSGTVTAVTSRRRFDTSLALGSPEPVSPYFRLGKLTWLTGENAGFTGQVKLDNEGDVLGNLSMWEDFPLDVEVGDTFTLTPGCDRRVETCRDVHNNIVNMRAPAIFSPGMDAIIRAP
jgi:uncharacterized phage protein (TIGR02218 family)